MQAAARAVSGHATAVLPKCLDEFPTPHGFARAED